MLPRALKRLIDEFSKLPGVGPKTAARLSFYLLTWPKEDLKNFGDTLSGLKDNLVTCSRCFNIAESDPCQICGEINRDETVLCVVEESLDVIALEKTGFKGIYHVLGGVISPIDGIGPEELKIKELLKRLETEDVAEVIMATDPSLEGEATASYIVSEIKKNKKNGNIKANLKIIRIARGLPIGGDLEYVDEATLSRALEGRLDFK